MNSPFSRGTTWQSHEIAQNAVLLPPAKFNAIPTSRRMISTSAFLLYALISGASENAKRP